ncbi:MAG: tripartite tricarboxylate transporter substrate binding protein [Alcaligenaceae bacterium]
MNRRIFVRSAMAGGLAFIGFPALAQQDKFPSKTIKFVVPFAAGGGGDAIARIAGQKLSERIHSPVVVENRTGAGGTVGSNYVMKSVPDGYTLLNMSSSYCIQAAMGPLPFDPILDMQPIIMLAQTPMVLLVHNDSPFQNAADLIAAAKKNPDRYTHGSAGIGSIAHLSMEEFAYLADIKLVHVPYKGSSLAMNDLLGGNVDLLLSTSTFTAPYVKSKRVRALGIAGQTRLSILAEVATFEEQGVKDFNVVDNKALAGPKGIPPEVVAYLNTELNAVLKEKAVYTRLEDEGTTPVGGSPEHMMQLTRKDIARWKKVIELQKITPQ